MRVRPETPIHANPELPVSCAITIAQQLLRAQLRAPNGLAGSEAFGFDHGTLEPRASGAQWVKRLPMNSEPRGGGWANPSNTSCPSTTTRARPAWTNVNV